MTTPKFLAGALLLLAACNDPVKPVEQEQKVAPATVVVAVDTVRAVLPGRYRYNIGFFANAGPDYVGLGNKPSNPFVVVLRQ